MLLISLFGLFVVSFSKDIETPSNSTDDGIQSLHENNTETYCKLVRSTVIGTHRPEHDYIRTKRASEFLSTFSIDKLEQLTSDDWKSLLKDRFDYKCDAQKTFPRRYGELLIFPKLSCHDICRTCFPESLPLCLRRNIDNNFGLTCYCSYYHSDPINNHVFRIVD